MRRRWFFAALLALALSVLCLESPTTFAQPSSRPILVLISVDGWRWDYVQRFSPPALNALAAGGVAAEGLIPAFPSKTFPNHYTVVTGLYPNRHGIVSNTMRDPTLPGLFSLANVDVQQDTRWWGGVPLWVSVEQQGQIAATMFWPGSDVEIAGDRPTYWRSFDIKVSNTDRVDQILSWLRVPDPQRPTFLTLYFDEVDSVSHDFGPDDPALATAIGHIDAAIARLVAGVNDAGLSSRVDFVIVSDHGMAQLSKDRMIVLDDYVDADAVEVIDRSPLLGIAPRRGSVDDLYRALYGKHRALQVFKNEDLPARYRLAGHPRLPAVIGIADDGWDVTTRRAFAANRRPGGAHGYDPVHPSMHGLFIASGPAFRAGLKVPRFENVHVYDLLCRVLGVRPASNDGDANVTAGFLR